MTLTLKDLCVDHDYYASSSNFYSNEATTHWSTWPSFYAEFKKADVDMNLVYRWDIHLIDMEKGPCDGNYQMQIIIIGQRKGIYLPQIIDRVFEIDAPEIVSYLMPSFHKLISIWSPLSNSKNEQP